ncbi:MAG: porin [Bacteroidota bacterium]
MKTQFLISLVFLTSFLFHQAQAQFDSLLQDLKFYGGIDVYYTYDFNQPFSGERPGFLYSHTRHNAINVNTAHLGAAYTGEYIRGNFALVAGDYAVSNYVAEEQLFQNVLEANAGIKIAKNLWLDAGIFASHIGIEGGIGPENPVLSRSLIAHNSPFFESGAKLSYQINEEWFVSLLLLNGWQNIKENNDNKAIATQITFSPTEAITFNSSTFFGEGNNAPNNVESFRYFHNFYVIWQPNEKLYTAFAFDFGGDKLESRSDDDYLGWWGTAFLLNYALNDHWKAVGRVEHFNDPESIILNIFPAENKVTGFSAGIDYSPISNAFFRIEGKLLSASESLFEEDTADTTDRSSSNFAFTTSLGLSF